MQEPRPALENLCCLNYREAIVKTFGRAYPVPRRSHRGRPPAPVVRIPQGLVYAQIVKHRPAGRVQQVEVRPLFGKGKLAQVVADLGWTKANTSAIERFNLTDRMRNARKGTQNAVLFAADRPA